MIRVGRIKSASEKLTFQNFTPIVVMMSSSPYYSLSPYSLKIKGRIIENIYQMSKVYEKVPASKQTYSRWDPTVIWEHPAETHVIFRKSNEDNITFELTPEYYAWRRKGFNNPHAVRYPVGFHHRTNCLGSLKNVNDDQLLNYIEARKQIYIPNYFEAIQNEPQFLQLKRMLQQGKNLLIIEVDGPHEESLDYYQKKYAVEDNFIEDSTVLINQRNIDILLNDKKHAFGHGYCLAMALLNLDIN
jgi:hypothetical protein